MTQDLWRGPFGDAYTERNQQRDDQDRQPFWQDLQARHPVESVLEVGCNVGLNLRWIVAPRVLGVDINERALAIARQRVTGAEFQVGSITDLPLASESYELVFTAGVLIHVGPADLALAVRELFRVSSRYVLLMEYPAPQETVVPYRGEAAALWKRPWMDAVRPLVGLYPIWHRTVSGFDPGLTAYFYDKKAVRP